MEIHVSSKNIIHKSFSQEATEMKTTARGTSPQKRETTMIKLFKDVDLLDSHIRNKRTACNLQSCQRITRNHHEKTDLYILYPTRNTNLEDNLTSLSQLKLETILKQSARLDR